MARQLARWTEGLAAGGWPVEFFDVGLLKSGPHGGREGHGALAICTRRVAIGFDGILGRLGSERRLPWEAVHLFDSADDSYRMANFGFGTELGVVTFVSDRPSSARPGGGPFGGPRNDIADNVRPHLPSDGWDGPFKWSVHDVTRTREQLSDFVLRFLLNSRSAAWQMVPANQVATRCVQVLGRDEAAGLLRALDLPSVEDRVAALDVLRSLDDAGQLLVWMRALAGQIEEGLQFEEATLTDSRRQLIVSLQEVMGASSDAVTTHVIGRPRRSSASCSSKTTSMSFAKAFGCSPRR
jgi:hypothetical protein